MAFEALTALIPIIPGMITAGKSVWDGLVKPLLKGTGYNVSAEQDKEMLALEKEKDVKQFIEKLQTIERDLNQTAINQTYNGDNGISTAINTGVINHTTNYHLPEQQGDVKKSPINF